MSGIGRKLLRGALAILGVLLVLESTGWIAHWVVTGRPFSYLRADGGAPTAPAIGLASGAGAGVERFTLGTEMLHPYLGFVQNPDVTRVRDGDGWRDRSPITPHGFFDFGFDSDPAGGGETMTVAVVGGSVAVHMLRYGSEALADGLREAGVWRGGRLRIIDWSNPGYKQPQQLLTASYLIGIGERPDLIINLDGYNDLVLGYTENVADDVDPFYPRQWRRRIEGLPDLEAQRLAGESVFLQAARERLRGWRSRSWAGHSALVALAAMRVEQWLQGLQTRAELRLAAAPATPTDAARRSMGLRSRRTSRR